MKIFGVRPALWPTVMTVPAVLVMLALGTWQVERLAWKEELISTRQARISEPAMPPSADIDPVADEYRRVRLTGEYLHDREMYLASRSLRGNAGYHVVTPLRLTDGSHVMVDRGWVPLDRREPATRASGQVEGTVTIEGAVRNPGRKGAFTADNQPDKNFWMFVDLEQMATAAGVDRVRPWFVEVTQPATRADLPIANQVRVVLPNDHLQYAITWYALAAGLIVIYILYHRGRET